MVLADSIPRVDAALAAEPRRSAVASTSSTAGPGVRQRTVSIGTNRPHRVQFMEPPPCALARADTGRQQLRLELGLQIVTQLMALMRDVEHVQRLVSLSVDHHH